MDTNNIGWLVIVMELEFQFRGKIKDNIKNNLKIFIENFGFGQNPTRLSFTHDELGNTQNVQVGLDTY